MNKEKQTITFELPVELTDVMVKKITEQMKDQYYWGVTKEISDKLMEKFKEHEFVNKIADKVFEEISVNEDEFVKTISVQMKDSLLSCMTTIANETVKEVQKKVKSYGFIKIGDRF
jgi:IMP dehydrogenase/GMP reductase